MGDYDDGPPKQLMQAMLRASSDYETDGAPPTRRRLAESTPSDSRTHYSIKEDEGSVALILQNPYSTGICASRRLPRSLAKARLA